VTENTDRYYKTICHEEKQQVASNVQKLEKQQIVFTPQTNG